MTTASNRKFNWSMNAAMLSGLLPGVLIAYGFDWTPSAIMSGIFIGSATSIYAMWALSEHDRNRRQRLFDGEVAALVAEADDERLQAEAAEATLHAARQARQQNQVH